MTTLPAPPSVSSRRRRAAARAICLCALVGLPEPSARAQALANLEQEAFNGAVAAVADSVVQIRTVGGLEQVDNMALALGPTTGLIVSGDGYIVSSAYNFAQQPTSILVRLPGGAQRAAEIVGHNTNLMLVLLKVDASEPLPVPEAAPLEGVQVGDWAVAVGRTYQADHVNMSVGIVSARGRMHGRALQTDANVSAANYGGPLVDIRGRVLGVLVPMAPQSNAGETSEVAGAEHYDSGIGFAVPLEQVMASLPRWIDQKELERGLLGVGMTAGNPHATPPTLSAVWPKSPAAKAGWKDGDRILSVDGQAVETQTQLRFQVVPHYAGDKLKVKLRRGTGDDAEELDTEIELAARLEPYRHAFLGVLPERPAAAEDGKQAPPGVTVRAVWPGSPADHAELKPGDRITHLGGKKTASIDKALSQLNAKSPDDTLTIAIQRADEKIEREVQLAELPTKILSSNDLPTAADRDDLDVASTAADLQKLRLPEFPQPALYFLPPDAGPAPGMLLWLSDGREESIESLLAAWDTVCRRDRLALVIASPADKRGWSTADMDYLGQLVPMAMRRIKADPRRVVLAGEGKAGQLAYALAMKARKWIRGVAVFDAPLPRTLELPPNNPNERLAIFSAEKKNLPLATLIRQDLARLQEVGYPPTRVVSSADDQLDAVTRSKLARWIDGLDRF